MPPITITSARVVNESSTGVPMLELFYRLPDEMVPHTDPAQAAQGKSMNDDPTYGGHSHFVPMEAIALRCALYGIDNAVEAVEEMIHETISTPYRDPHKHPSHAERKASRQRFPLVGLTKSLRDAGITLNDPPDAVVADLENQILYRFGRDELARIRGVAPSTLPDPVAATAQRHKRGNPGFDEMPVLVKTRLPKRSTR